MKIPKPIQNLIDAFEKLPGIGPKTAQRLTFYLLHVPQHQLDQFARSLVDLKKNTVLCSICRNIGESDPCQFCADQSRERNVIAVVEQPLDILSFEKTGQYRGVYHVLHGNINPLENIGPDELYINDLLERAKAMPELEEIILAMNPTMEGEATAMYLTRKLRELKDNIKVTRLGMGIPTGAYLEFADETTMRQAIQGRREM